MSTSCVHLVSFLSPCHVTSLLFFAALYLAPLRPNHPQVSANLLLADACFALGKFARFFPARITEPTSMHTCPMLAYHQVYGLLLLQRMEQATCRLQRLLRTLRWQQQALSVRCAHAACISSRAAALHLTCAAFRDAAAPSGGQSGVGAKGRRHHAEFMRDQQGRAVVRMTTSLAAPSTVQRG
jgi:hypothetical protein